MDCIWVNKSIMCRHVFCRNVSKWHHASHVKKIGIDITQVFVQSRFLLNLTYGRGAACKTQSNPDMALQYQIWNFALSPLSVTMIFSLSLFSISKTWLQVYWGYNCNSVHHVVENIHFVVDSICHIEVNIAFITPNKNIHHVVESPAETVLTLNKTFIMSLKSPARIVL